MNFRSSYFWGEKSNAFPFNNPYFHRKCIHMHNNRKKFECIPIYAALKKKKKVECDNTPRR